MIYFAHDGRVKGRPVFEEVKRFQSFGAVSVRILSPGDAESNPSKVLTTPGGWVSVSSNPGLGRETQGSGLDSDPQTGDRGRVGGMTEESSHSGTSVPRTLSSVRRRCV